MSKLNVWSCLRDDNISLYCAIFSAGSEIAPPFALAKGKEPR